tara:strand:+ start:290 stop:925 length:636 start_codon:yes stop_codon:yes gene_type:complete
MSNASAKKTMNLYKMGGDFKDKSRIASCDLTDDEYKQVFMSQHKFCLKSSYNTKFICGNFCNLTVSVNPQIIENRKTIDMIKQIYKDACKEVDCDEVQPYKNLSTSIFSVFLEKLTLNVKNMLTQDHNIILNKLYNKADIEIMQTGVKVSVNFQVCDDYVMEKDLGIVSVDKFKESNGIYPNFESWNTAQKSNKIKINLIGEACLINNQII